MSGNEPPGSPQELFAKLQQLESKVEDMESKQNKIMDALANHEIVTLEGDVPTGDDDGGDGGGDGDGDGGGNGDCDKDCAGLQDVAEALDDINETLKEIRDRS